MLQGHCNTTWLFRVSSGCLLLNDAVNSRHPTSHSPCTHCINLQLAVAFELSGSGCYTALHNRQRLCIKPHQLLLLGNNLLRLRLLTRRCCACGCRPSSPAASTSTLHAAASTPGGCLLSTAAAEATTELGVVGAWGSGLRQ